MPISKYYDHQPFLDASAGLPLDAPFTRTQALDEGVPDARLRRFVDLGLLRRPIKGVYVASQLKDSPELRARCISLVVPADYVVCDRHAGWLLGADMVLAPGEHLERSPISVFRPSGHGRLRNDLCDSGERNLLSGDITEVHGLAVTTPLRTAYDLGRVRSREHALSGLDAMLRLGGFSSAELVWGVERFRGMRWITRLRELAPIADGRAASPGESVLRLRWIDGGLPSPQLQVEVWIDRVLIAILDLAHEELRYAAEYDGEQWHSSPEQIQHDQERRSLVSDEGWLINVFRKEHVYGHQQTADATLRAGVAESRRRHSQPTNERVVAS